MDEIDRRIIGILATDGRISVADLADAVSLSASATSDRLRRLRTTGVITGFTVVLDPEAIERPIDAVIEIKLDAERGFDSLDEEIAQLGDVIDAVHLTGSFDYLLRVRTRSISGIEELIRYLKNELGVRETSTRIVLRTIDQFPRIPLP